MTGSNIYDQFDDPPPAANPPAPAGGNYFDRFDEPPKRLLSDAEVFGSATTPQNAPNRELTYEEFFGQRPDDAPASAEPVVRSGKSALPHAPRTIGGGSQPSTEDPYLQFLEPSARGASPAASSSAMPDDPYAQFIEGEPKAPRASRGASTSSRPLMSDEEVFGGGDGMAGPLSNTEQDSILSGTAKGTATAAIKGLSHIPGMFGDIRDFGHYLADRAISAATGKPYEQVRQEGEAARARWRLPESRQGYS